MNANTIRSQTDLNAFLSGRSDVLSIYVPAGYPEFDSMPRMLQALDASGVDMVEVGIPYSDPLADGTVIQGCHTHALANGMTLRSLFGQLASVQARMPILLMGYFNVVLQYGIEQFCQSCAGHGVSGVIIPDMPVDLYASAYKDYFEENNLSCVFMITPQTSEERVRYIDKMTTGFIYAVSSASTTGTKNSRFSRDYLQKLSSMRLKNHVLTGFNISDHSTFTEACTYTKGAIIGSAFLRHISGTADLEQSITSFIEHIRSS